METGRQPSEKLLSSGMTPFWRDVFPLIWTVGVGAGMAGIWLELFGEPASMGLKVLGVAIWAGTSTLFTAWSRRIYQVWIHGSDLIVLSSGRRHRVPLQDVTEIAETRAQKIKTIRLSFRPGSPLGPTIRFIPVHRFQAPFSEHPVIGELKERKRLLAGAGKNRELRP